MRFLSFLIKGIKNNLILSLIILVGLTLRFLSVSPGYYYPHGDELLYSQALYMIINKTLSFQMQYLGFPPLIPWLMIPFFLGFFIPASWLAVLIKNMPQVYLLFVPAVLFLALLSFLLRKKIKFAKTFLFSFWVLLAVSGVMVISKGTLFHNEILGKNWISALYWGRYLTAAFGTAAIFLTYKTTLEFFKRKRIGLFAALFCAVNYRLVLNSHVGLPDMFNVFFLMLSMFFIARLYKKPTFRNYIFAWVSSAATFLIKYQTHILAPLFIAHFLISIKSSGGKFKRFLSLFFSKKVIIGGLIAVAVVLLSHIYHFKNWEKVLEINRYQAIKYGFGRNIFDLFVVSYFYHIGIGSTLSLASVLGIVLGFAKKEFRIGSLILISTLPTFLFLYLYYTGGGFYTRNLISAVPILLIFAALFTDFVLDFAGRFVKNRILHVFLTALILLFLIFGQFKNSAVSAWEYSQKAPRVKAQEWLDENIRGAVVFGRYMGNPIPHDEKVILKNMLPYAHAFSYQELLEEGFGKSILELTWMRAETLWWTRKPPKIQIKFWNKPNNLLSQSYYSLAFRELLYAHGLGLFITPWQAVSHHFAVVDLGKEKPFGSVKKIYSADDFSMGWYALSFLREESQILKKVKNNDDATKLVIDRGEAIPGGVRFQSAALNVEGKRGYLVKAKVRISGEVKKEERQAFIRLDFYSKGPEPDVLSRPDVSFVSKRVFGKDGLYDVYVQGVAPEDSKFAVIGFQGTSISASYALEFLEVFETTVAVDDKFPKIRISDDDLFLPNDEGIL